MLQLLLFSYPVWVDVGFLLFKADIMWRAYGLLASFETWLTEQEVFFRHLGQAKAPSLPLGMDYKKILLFIININLSLNGIYLDAYKAESVVTAQEFGLTDVFVVGIKADVTTCEILSFIVYYGCRHFKTIFFLM